MTSKGVTAWRHALTSLTSPAPAVRPPAGASPASTPELAATVTRELISALAAMTLAQA